MDNANLDGLLSPYRRLDTAAPGLAVFHTRLGLSVIDAIGGIEHPRAHGIAIDLIDRATTFQDGYAARDLLAHNNCANLLIAHQTRELTEVVEACALESRTLPATLRRDLSTALDSSEEVITRAVTVAERPTRATSAG